MNKWRDCAIYRLSRKAALPVANNAHNRSYIDDSLNNFLAENQFAKRTQKSRCCMSV